MDDESGESMEPMEEDFVLIPTHFCHATTLQLRAFARHSAS